jgi:hypothetical protein
MNLTTHHHLVPRLRISGIITLLSLYALMALTGSASLYLYFDIVTYILA